MTVSKRAACLWHRPTPGESALGRKWHGILGSITVPDWAEAYHVDAITWSLVLFSCGGYDGSGGSSSFSKILSSWRACRVLCFSELTRLLSLTSVEIQLEISIKWITAPRGRGVFFLLLFTVVLSEPGRDRGTSLWINEKYNQAYQLECIPWKSAGDLRQDVHRSPNVWRWGFQFNVFIKDPSPFFSIQDLSFLSKPSVLNSHYVRYLSSWSQDDDDDDDSINNNNYYYNGKDTWSELLCANHRSKPLPYFHSLNIHVNP